MTGECGLVRSAERCVVVAALAGLCGSFAATARASAMAGVSAPALSLDAAEAPAASESAPADKWGYTLFNPTPRSLMRDFNADRPDVTESPYTVDAGHYQLEFSFVEYTHDDDHGVKTDGLSVLPANLRIGVLNNLEIDLMANPYENVLTHGNGISSRASGYGDMAVRAKVNFWGNDGGATAGGVIPFLTIPTGQDGLSDHHVEGGVIFPLAVELPAGFDLGTQVEFDFDRNKKDDGYGMELVQTVTVGHDIVKNLSAYVEYVGVSPIDTGQTYLAYCDTGLMYLIGENMEVDVGVNVGVSDHAPDYLVFSGMSFRY
ncbi:MAG TPA: transporter [Phycisphaerae bacterium]|nr:transporter [Phycisphaerae bacterium]